VQSSEAKEASTTGRSLGTASGLGVRRDRLVSLYLVMEHVAELPFVHRLTASLASVEMALFMGGLRLQPVRTTSRGFSSSRVGFICHRPVARDCAPS
jgi:hypothetical protein